MQISRAADQISAGCEKTRLASNLHRKKGPLPLREEPNKPKSQCSFHEAVEIESGVWVHKRLARLPRNLGEQANRRKEWDKKAKRRHAVNGKHAGNYDKATKSGRDCSPYFNGPCFINVSAPRGLTFYAGLTLAFIEPQTLRFTRSMTSMAAIRIRYLFAWEMLLYSSIKVHLLCQVAFTLSEYDHISAAYRYPSKMKNKGRHEGSIMLRNILEKQPYCFLVFLLLHVCLFLRIIVLKYSLNFAEVLVLCSLGLLNSQ